MNILLQIILEASTAALLSLFLEFCFREGNIFSFWLSFWGELYRVVFPYKIPHQKIMISETNGECLTERDYMIWKAWLITKPLGYCIVCFNFWVTLFFVNTNLLNYQLKEVILLFGLSSIIVRILNKII